MTGDFHLGESEGLGERPAPMIEQLPEPTDVSGFPPLAARVAYGGLAGLVLGALHGALLHYISGVASPKETGIWGIALGAAAGTLLGRTLRGPATGMWLGTTLGLLYGIVPGLTVLYQSIIVNRIIGPWSLTGLFMACPMAGLLIGGVLDRCFEALVGVGRPDEGGQDPTIHRRGGPV
jgi:hypothetical protein